MRSLAPHLTWPPAVMLVALPVVIAFDFGGVLHWTQLLASYVIVIAAPFAFAGIVPDSETVGRQSAREHRLILLALLWVFVMWLQTLEVSPRLSETLAPGTSAAYTDWLLPIVDPDDPHVASLNESMPLSLVPELTTHFAALASLVLLLAWSAAWVFDEPRRVGFLLVAASVGVATQASYGIWCIFFPADAITASSSNPNALNFGSFVNRNNATLFLNLGLATGIGAIAWRLSGQQLLHTDDNEFEWDDLLSILHDKTCVLAAIASCLCFAGIVVSGSGVGVIGCVAGVLATVNWFQSRYHVAVFAVGLLTVGLSVGYFFASYDPGDSIPSPFFTQTLNEDETVIKDTRWAHWRDSLATASAHLPLGSGIGTYGFAYLPFQKYGAPYWFQHADNLWLELFVEQGYFALPICMAIGVITFLSVRNLYEATEPADTGIRIAALFAMGAVLATQALDFGLLLLPNLILFTLIVMAANARGQIARYVNGLKLTEQPATPNLFSIARPAALGVIALVLASSSIPILYRDAVAETVISTCENLVDSESVEVDKIDPALEAMDRLLQSNPTFAAHNIASRLVHRRARLADVAEQNHTNEADAAEAYVQTGLLRKRMQPLEDSQTDLPSYRMYGKARDHAVEALYRCPTVIDARAEMVYLDFVGDARRHTNPIVRQLAELQRRDVKTLLRLAEIAESDDEIELASSIHQAVCLLDPRFSGSSVMYVERNPAVQLTQLIPEIKESQIVAAKHLLQNDSEDYSIHGQVAPFLTQALTHFACEKSESKAIRSNCEFFAGNVCFHIEEYLQGLEHYRMAVELTPADPAKRLIYIQRLHQNGYSEVALIEARKARVQIPSDKRFQSFINRMAAESIDAAED